MSTMRVHGTTVRLAGTHVATLTYSGPLVSVRDPQDPNKVVGRLFRRGVGDAVVYEAWTAMHPAAVTPSDRMLSPGCSLEAAIGLVLDAAKAAS